MDRQAILEIIADQKRKKPITKIIEREQFIYKGSQDGGQFIEVFSGIRRCGKSTLLQLIREKNSEQDYYLNFDDERLINFQVSDFEKLYELFLEKFGEQRIFYFDEIQNIVGWERFVRRLYNDGNKIYITGSNAQLLSRELGTHLTGRTLKRELYPFSFREYLKLKDFVVPKFDILSTKERVKFCLLFAGYVKNGGFPEYLLTGNCDYLKQLYENIIYRDIVVRYKLPNEKVLKEVGLYCASNIGKLTSFNSLKTMFGAGSATTLKEYLEYFENSYLFFSVNKFDYSFKKQIYAPKKIYSIDTRLAQEIGFRFSQDKGRYLENIVFLELKRRGKNIFYHSGNSECDFITQEGSVIQQAIQVTTGIENEIIKKREYLGLVEAMDCYNLKTCLLLTENDEAEEKINGKKIQILPIWKWLIA